MAVSLSEVREAIRVLSYSIAGYPHLIEDDDEALFTTIGFLVDVESELQEVN